MESMSKKGSILLTGANGGLGRGLASKIVTKPELAKHYHVIFTVRNASAPASVLGPLNSILTPATRKGHSHEILSLDLSRLTAVREFAAAINTRVAAGEIPPIRLLILCAGFIEGGKETATEEGFDTSFAANYLGHWLLTLLLLQSMDKKEGRIVVVGSSSYDPEHGSHRLGEIFKEEKWKVFFKDDNIDTAAKGTWSPSGPTPDEAPFKAGMRRYGVSKMCLAMMTPSLQHRLNADPDLHEISVVTVDPGTMASGLMRRGDWFTRNIVFPFVMPVIAMIMNRFNPRNSYVRPIGKSADDLLSAALEVGPRLRGKHVDGRIVIDLTPEAADEEKRAMVWRDSIRYTGLSAQDTALVHFD